MMRKLVKYELACTPYCHFDNRTSDCTVIRFMRVNIGWVIPCIWKRGGGLDHMTSGHIDGAAHGEYL